MNVAVQQNNSIIIPLSRVGYPAIQRDGHLRDTLEVLHMALVAQGRKARP